MNKKINEYNEHFEIGVLMSTCRGYTLQETWSRTNINTEPKSSWENTCGLVATLGQDTHTPMNR
jgi:hypothetical protein